jgi:hypothetical protein
MNSKTRVFIWGSCVSRDTFEHMDPDKFELVAYVARQSALSATTRPVEQIAAPQMTSRFQQRMISGDFGSNLRPLLKEHAADTDVLLVDLTDERLGVYLLPDGTVVTRSVELIESGLDQTVAQNAQHLPFGTQQHFEYWSGAIQAAGDAIRQAMPGVTVALLDIPWAEWSESGQQTPDSFGVTAARANPVFRPYVETAVKALGAHLVSIDPSRVLSGPNHPWGDAPFHYAEHVYIDAVRQLTGAEGRSVWGDAGSPTQQDQLAHHRSTDISASLEPSSMSGSNTPDSTHKSPDLAVTLVISNDNDAYALGTCLDSILGQSIGVDNVEVLVVDNGSTDATQQVINQYQHQFPRGLLRMIPQERSASNAVGRNTAISEARGTYIYFVNASDHLGNEALHAMTHRAQVNSSDIVVGKLIGVGRGAPRKMFEKSHDRATLKDFQVTDVLHAHCLYSTRFLREKSIGFKASLHAFIEQPFAMSAYALTENIAIEAETDCYFLVRHMETPEKPPAAKPVGPVRPHAPIWATFQAASSGKIPLERRRKLKAQYWNRLLTRDLVDEFGKKKGASARSAFVAEVNRLIGAHDPEEHLKNLSARARVFFFLAQTGRPEALDALLGLTKTSTNK